MVKNLVAGLLRLTLATGSRCPRAVALDKLIRANPGEGFDIVNVLRVICQELSLVL